jgi:hypothetical protein
VSPISDELQASDPDVAFFVERNPGYVHGDELACLAKMRYADMVTTMWKARRTRKAKRA